MPSLATARRAPSSRTAKSWMLRRNSRRPALNTVIAESIGLIEMKQSLCHARPPSRERKISYLRLTYSDPSDPISSALPRVRSMAGFHSARTMGRQECGGTWEVIWISVAAVAERHIADHIACPRKIQSKRPGRTFLEDSLAQEVAPNLPQSQRTHEFRTPLPDSPLTNFGIQGYAKAARPEEIGRGPVPIPELFGNVQGGHALDERPANREHDTIQIGRAHV